MGTDKRPCKNCGKADCVTVGAKPVEVTGEKADLLRQKKQKTIVSLRGRLANRNGRIAQLELKEKRKDGK